MKVCFVSHSSAKGGAERAMLELINALIKQGVEVYVILPSYGPLVEELKKDAIVYRIFPYKWWMSKNSPKWKRLGRLVINFILLIPVASQVKTWNCDIVYTNTITVCIGAFAARLLGLPHIWHIHEFGYEEYGLVYDFDSRISLKLINNLSTFCIAVSYSVAEVYSKNIESSKLKVIYQSVTVPEDVCSKKNEVLPNLIKCVIIGALQEGKHQEEAIMAINELVHRGIKAYLYIVGSGDPQYTEYLRDMINKNKLDDYICFTGYKQDPFHFVCIANAVLICSRREAFGGVTIEAMKLGRPVIGARSGGTAELITDGFNGLLYTPGNYMELADRIYYLCTHPEVVERLVDNGKKWSEERFNQDYYGKEVLKVLQAACDFKN